MSRDKRLLGCLVIACNLAVLVLLHLGNKDLVRGDFKMFYTAAIALRTGHGTQVYDRNFHARLQTAILPSLPPQYVKNYTHPPYELLIYLPLSFLNYRLACYCWVAVSLGLAVVCGRLLGSYATVLCLFPLVMVADYQQDTILVLLLVVTCWIALQNNQDTLGGLILGLALFRFQVILPMALILLFWKPRLIRGLVISSATVILLSLVLVGPAGMRSYVDYIYGMAHGSTTAVNHYYIMDPRSNPSIRGLVYEILSRGTETVSPKIAKAVPIATGLLYFAALGYAWKFMRRTAQPEAKFSAAILLALLLSFHLLMHDLVLLAMPFTLLRGFKARWPLAPFYVAPFVLFFYPNSISWLALLVGAAAIMAYFNTTSPRLPSSSFRACSSARVSVA